jgi:hypothetical protein
MGCCGDGEVENEWVRVEVYYCRIQFLNRLRENWVQQLSDFCELMSPLGGWQERRPEGARRRADQGSNVQRHPLLHHLRRFLRLRSEHIILYTLLACAISAPCWWLKCASGTQQPHFSCVHLFPLSSKDCCNWMIDVLNQSEYNRNL